MHSTFTICVAIMLLLVTPTATFARSAGSPEETKLSFIENKGQITDQNFNTRNDIDFKLETRALNVFVGNGKLHYQWSRLENAEEFARDSDKDQ